MVLLSTLTKNNRAKLIKIQEYNTAKRVNNRPYASACSTRVSDMILRSGATFTRGDETLVLKKDFLAFWRKTNHPIVREIVREWHAVGFAIVSFKHISFVMNGKVSTELVPYVIAEGIGSDFDIYVYNDPKHNGSIELHYFRKIDQDGNPISPISDDNVLIFVGPDGMPNSDGSINSPAAKVIKEVMTNEQLNVFRMTREFRNTYTINYTQTTEKSEGIIKPADMFIEYGDKSDTVRSLDSRVIKNQDEFNNLYTNQQRVIEQFNMKKVMASASQDLSENILNNQKTAYSMVSTVPLPIGHELVNAQTLPQYQGWKDDVMILETIISTIYGVPRSLMVNDAPRSGGERGMDAVTNTFSLRVEAYKQTLSEALTDIYNIIYGPTDEMQTILFTLLNESMGFNGYDSTNLGFNGSGAIFSMGNVNTLMRKAVAAQKLIDKTKSFASLDENKDYTLMDDPLNPPQNIPQDKDEFRDELFNKENALDIFKDWAETAVSNIIRLTSPEMLAKRRLYPEKEEMDPNELKFFESNGPPLRGYDPAKENLGPGHDVGYEPGKEMIRYGDTDKYNISDNSILLQRLKKMGYDQLDVLIGIALAKSTMFPDYLKRFSSKGGDKMGDTTRLFKFSPEMIKKSNESTKIIIQFNSELTVDEQKLGGLYSSGIINYKTYAQKMVELSKIDPSTIKIPNQDPFGIEMKLAMFRKFNAKGISNLAEVGDLLYPKPQTKSENKSEDNPNSNKKRKSSDSDNKDEGSSSDKSKSSDKSEKIESKQKNKKTKVE